MKFVTINDIRVELKDYMSDQMTDGNFAYFDDIEAAAIELVKAYTQSICNIDHEITKEGKDRNADLKRVIVILMVYDVEARIATEEIRENTARRYSDIMKYLREIQERKTTPTWLLKDSDIDESVAASEYYSDPILMRSKRY